MKTILRFFGAIFVVLKIVTLPFYGFVFLAWKMWDESYSMEDDLEEQGYILIGLMLLFVQMAIYLATIIYLTSFIPTGG